MRRTFSFPKLLKSFAFAGKGIGYVWRSEPNFRVHVVVALLAISLGFALQIEGYEWIAITLCIGGVMSAEALNSALEVLADATHPNQHPLIGKAKDASAGAVLLIALAALAVGAIIFVPKLWLLITTLPVPSG
jgi:diacylglycerol kinase (ATP)